MLNLKLFTHLQGSAAASLFLKASAPGRLQYFLMSASVNYSIITAGTCEGELPGNTPLSFDIVLSTMAPLLDKNNQFKLEYSNGSLNFVSANGKFTINPLCVEHISDYAPDIANRYLRFSEKLHEYEGSVEKLAEAEQELLQLQASYKQASHAIRSGWVNSSPFGDADAVSSDNALDVDYKGRIMACEGKIAKLRASMESIKEVKLSEFKRISNVAAKHGTVVSMCQTYALVALKTSFIFQKQACDTRTLQGKLLQRLLMEDNGSFYEFEDELVFATYAGKGDDRSDTFVFLQTYLPSTSVDDSLITKGAVLEKYSLNLKGMLPIISSVQSKFETMTFDMGSSTLIMANDRGERLVYKFDVEDARTIALNKALRGEESGPIVMSSVDIPKEVQSVLSLFRDDFKIYVKSNKVVLQSGTMYVVFAK